MVKKTITAKHRAILPGDVRQFVNRNHSYPVLVKEQLPRTKLWVVQPLSGGHPFNVYPEELHPLPKGSD